MHLRHRNILVEYCTAYVHFRKVQHLPNLTYSLSPFFSWSCRRSDFCRTTFRTLTANSIRRHKELQCIIMAATMAASTSVLGGLKSLSVSSDLRRPSYSKGSFGLVLRGKSSRLSTIRCEGIRETVDRATKKEITKEEVLQNQETNESEQKSVFGAKPTSGSFYPRPEVERRPETGEKTFGSLFAFDGAAPETINGRLAMVGIVWAAVAERMSGLTVFDQLYTQGTGLVFYVALVPLIAYASIVPMLNGESSDSRSFGPFTARAERWNGRLAMLGFLSLLLTENFIHSPVFKTFF